jgi:hypothetical protein
MLNALNIKKIVYGTLAVFVIVYLLRAFLSPLDPETLIKYNVSELQLRLLSASILLPLVAIWACAAYGFVHFKLYALSIKGAAPGKGTNTIANGLGIIAAQLLVSGGFSSVSSLSAVKAALGGDKGVEVISTVLTLGFALVTAIVLYHGTVQLNSSLGKRAKPKIVTDTFYLLTVISIGFLIAIATRYNGSDASVSIYDYLPISAAIALVGIPFVIVWNFYLLAAKNLYYYRKHVKGRVYKQSLRLLTTGIYLILGSSVIVQLLGTLGELFANLRLVALLVIVYVLVAIIAVGYLYIARAATKLSKVEN